MKLSLPLRSFLLSCGSMLAASSLHGADVTWDTAPGTVGVGNGTVTGGVGEWNTANGNWTKDGGANNIAWVNGSNTAIFGGTAGVVTLGSDVTVGGLTFNTTNYSIAAGAGPYKITLGAATELNANYTSNINSMSGISAEIVGSSTITKTGTGFLRLEGVSDSFTGDVVVSGGTLQIGNNNTKSRLGGATYAGNIALNGGNIRFTNDLRDAPTGAGPQTLSGIISGTGTFDRGGQGILTLAGANTYTGKTFIRGSGAGAPGLSVSSFNSVTTNLGLGTVHSASSSLGAPTTVADGTIDLGGPNQRSVVLIYTGSGETTDRVMNVIFNSSGNRTIQADTTGGGLLKFTSDFTGSGGSTPSGTLVLDGSGAGEIAGNIAAFTGYTAGKLTKDGTGIWTLSGTNGNTGVTAVNAGRLNVTGTLASSAMTVANNATLSGTGTMEGTLAFSTGSTIMGTTAGSSFKAETVTASGVAGVKIVGSDGSGTIGSHTIGVVRYNSGTGPATANFSTAGYHAGASVSNVGGAGGETQLTYTNAARTWNSASGTWDAMVTNAWQEGDLKFGHGDAVTFDDSGTGGGAARTVTLNSFITPGSVAFNNSTSTPYTVSGTGSLSGLTGLTKTGDGIVTLSTHNTYTGATTVTEGTLLINGSTSTSLLTVGVDGTLGGSGKVGGATTVNGALKPGNSPGLLSFGNSLALAGTATTTMEIDGTELGLEHDSVDVATSLVYGGALILDLGTVFGEGDYIFNLFDFGGQSDSFETVDLAGLYSGSLTDDGFGNWNLNSGGNTWTFTQSTGDLSLSVIPEPSVALFAGLGMLGLLRRRR